MIAADVAGAIPMLQSNGDAVAAVDVADEELALARKLGAELTVNSSTDDPVTKIQETIGGSHGVLITAVSPVAFRQGVNCSTRQHLRAERVAATATSWSRSSTWC